MSSLLARMRSKPKQSDDNGQVEAAVAKLKDARRFEDSKQYSTAVMLYEEGLRLLIERHQQESDEPNRAVILKTVEEYMARAERCKQLAQAKRPDHDNYGARPRPPKVPARRTPPKRRTSPPPFKRPRTSSGIPSKLGFCRRCSTVLQLSSGRTWPVSKRRNARSKRLWSCRT